MLGRALAGGLLSAMMIFGVPSAGLADGAGARLTTIVGADHRLKLDVVPGAWSVRQEEDEIEVRFSGLDVEIALPTAIRPPFAGVTADRIGGDTVLRVVADCACSLAITAFGDGLSLDLVPAPPAGGDPAPFRAPVPVERATGPDAVEPAAPAQERWGEERWAAERWSEERLATVTGDGRVDAAEVRERLMSQLLRAAEAGLIELEEPVGGLDGEQTAAAQLPEEPILPEEAVVKDDSEEDGEEDGDEISDGAAPGEAADAGLAPVVTDPAATGSGRGSGRVEAPELPHADSPDLIISGETVTAGDGDAAAHEFASGPTEETEIDEVTAEQAPPICHAGEVIELPRFADGAEWIHRVAALRARLSQELDRMDPEVARELARLYIAAGLVDEALANLREFGGAGAETSVLTELAMAVGGRSLPVSGSLLREDCLDTQALWRAAALASAGVRRQRPWAI